MKLNRHPEDVLTEREREILAGRRRGDTTSALAARFGIGRSRIGQILQTIDRKLATLQRAKAAAVISHDPLDTPIELLPLSTRAVNGLLQYGKRTVRDLIRCSPQEILQMKNVGPACLRQIEALVRLSRIP